MRRTESNLSRRDDPLAAGMLFLMQQMSQFIDRSFDLLESQLEESRLQQDVLRMEKALLEKRLQDEGVEHDADH